MPLILCQGQSMKYEITNDTDQVERYCAIIRQTYNDVLGVDVALMQQHYKEKSHILILTEGLSVVGGAFLVISMPQDRLELPMETKEFKLQNILPDYDLSNKVYGEVCRLALMPQFRGIETISKIFSKLIAKSSEVNCRYLFSIAPPAQAKAYRIAGLKIGVKIQTRSEVSVPHKPEYKHNKMILSILEL